MSPLKTTVIAAIIASALTSGWQYHVRQERAEEVVRLQVESERLLQQHGERPSAGMANTHALPASDSPPVSGGRSNRALAMKPPARPIDENPRPREANHRNEGQATPGSTMQTLAWACDQGDARLMETLLMFDADAREKAEDYFAGLPSEIRTRWESVDAMAADLYISDGMNHPYPGSEYLRRAKFDQIKPGRVVLRLPGANGDGYEFQQTAQGWKLAITLAVVDHSIEDLSKPGPSR